MRPIKSTRLRHSNYPIANGTLMPTLERMTAPGRNESFPFPKAAASPSHDLPCKGRPKIKTLGSFFRAQPDARSLHVANRRELRAAEQVSSHDRLLNPFASRAV